MTTQNPTEIADNPEGMSKEELENKIRELENKIIKLENELKFYKVHWLRHF